jgi:signal transduction histidine kinase
MTENEIAAAALFVPALLWTIIATNASQGFRSRRPDSPPVRLALVSALMAMHYGLSVLMRLTPTDLDWQAPGLTVGLSLLDTACVVGGIALFSHRGPLWPLHDDRPRSRRWLAANYGAAALVIALAPLPQLVWTPGVWLAWFYSTTAALLYCITVTGLVLHNMYRHARRGGWRPGRLVGVRSFDVALVAGGFVFVSAIAALVLLSSGIGFSITARRVLLVLHVALGLSLAAVPAVRILGEVVRGFLLVATLLITIAMVYFGTQTLTAGLTPELHRLLDLAAILVLALLLLPGQMWLRRAIDRVVFRRGRRQAELLAFVRELSPELGTLECARRGLAEIARVMRLRGAAIVLRDGEAAAHGTFALDPLRRAWPRGAAADALPTRPFVGAALRDAGLREALAEAEVVGVAPVVSPRQRWGHLFITTGLLGATFIDEDAEIVETFAAQLALVLDGAELLARSLAVERALAHAEKLAAIGELAARVAHEIRNPVTAARSLAQQLGREPQSPLNAEHAQVILTELERVERQVAALLRFARREEFRFEPVDVATLVRTTVNELHPRLEAGGVHVTLAAADGVTARADREKLRQVLINVIENSLDALRETSGERRLAIDVGRENGAATIRVTDSGPGVAADALPRLFEPFFSLKAQGTGLGLAIARRTIEAHGGRIEARSPTGEGLSLTFELPLTDT